MSRIELLDAWLHAEREVVKAELEIAKMGQLSADPAMADKLRRVILLKEEANRLFRLLPPEPD